MTRLSVPALVLCAASLAPRAASADDAGTGVVVVGEATLQPALVAQIEGWVKQRQPPLVAQALDPEAINSTIDCFVLDDATCAKNVFDKKAKSTNLVFVRVEVVPGPHGARDVTLTGYWFTKGKDPVTHKKTCEQCTDAGVRAAADEILAAMSHTGNHDTGHLALSSRPAGARVTVDGKPAGTTPLEIDLPPGDHRIALEREGGPSEARMVSVRIGESAAIDLSLGGVGSSGGDGGGASYLGPKIAVGAGAALLVTGAVLVATSESDDGSKFEYRDTTLLGALVGVGGVLVVGAGAYWWHRDAHRMRESAPVVGATAHGAFVGWTGAF